MDGRDVKEIPLSHLRSGVTILSQDAYIFSGTVRDVMDPFGQVTDARKPGIRHTSGVADLSTRSYWASRP